MFGYGSGLSAYLTRTLLNHPGAVLPMARAAIPGLAHLLNPRSPKNSNKRRNYPRRLTVLELAGFAAGPLLYLPDRFRTRREQPAAAPSDVEREPESS